MNVSEIARRIPEAVERLRGEGIDVLVEDLEAYGRDETEDYFETPGLVARPRSTAEVAAVLRTADALDLPVTPRGGGTGKAAAAIPAPHGMVLALGRLNRIREIDVQNRFAVVEPGVVLQDLHEACAEHGLWYPVDMSSRGSCMIGGNLATNAGGERAVKYGVTRDQVRGVEAVLMGGSVIRTGGKTSKNSAGYALHHLLVGSEGTLGVITEATLRLLTLPPYRKALLAPFESLERAADAALAVEAAGVNPSALELIERSAAALSEEMLNERLPHADAAALLLVEVEGFHEGRTEENRDRAAEILLQNGAEDVMVAPRERVWRVRHAIAEAVKQLPAYTSVDACVPRSCMPRLVHEAHKIAVQNGLEVICFGHAGDGNIHTDFIRRRREDDSWDRNVKSAVRDYLRVVVAFGGTITGEHGLGLLRRDDLPLQLDASTIEAMRALKNAWDPKGLLNPGKILPPL